VAGSFEKDEIVLVADDTMTYVAVFGPTEQVFGRPSEELVGRHMSSVTPPESLAQMDASWSEFAAQGRLEGTYPLLARDGRRVMTRFRARAHHPVPGDHTSRLRAVGDPPHDVV
jgi:PAS domain-containing protein